MQKNIYIMLIRLIWTWLWEHFQLNKTRQVVSVYCNTVARSCHHCCYENATTRFLCTVDLQNISYCCQQHIQSYIFMWKTWCFCLISTTPGDSRSIFIKVPNIKPHENLSSGKFTDTCGWMDMMKQIYTFCCLCKMPKKPQSLSHLA